MLTAAYQSQINLLVYAAACAGNKRQSTELLVQSVILCKRYLDVFLHAFSAWAESYPGHAGENCPRAGQSHCQAKHSDNPAHCHARQ